MKDFKDVSVGDFGRGIEKREFRRATEICDK